MPIGYLVTMVIVGWCTLCALAPPRRPPLLGVLSFLCGFVLNELPFVAFAWIVVSTVLASGQSDLNSPVGLIGLAFALLTTTGLIVVIRRALTTAPALERALSDALGSDWHASLNAASVPGPHPRASLARMVLWPFLVRRRGVERVRNIRYGPAGRKNLLDLYRRRSGDPSTGGPSSGGPSTGRPVLIHLHGGALFMGRKSRESLPLIYRLADRGWVCVSANYRLRPAATFPDHLIDVKKAIAWVREHAYEYGIDPSLVFVAGSSSGAQLAALAALTANDPDYQPGFEPADTSVSAAICLHGYYGSPGSPDPDRVRSEPLAYAGRQQTVPFFIAHGDQDPLLSASTARLFAERLRSGSSQPVVYAQLPGAQHGFDRYRSLRFERVVDAIEDFTTWVRSANHPLL